jgi:hypothetical protein
MTTTTDHALPGTIDDAPPVLRLRAAPDLLAYLPHRLGFQPRESLVVAGIGGPRRRLGLVARVDLADLAGPAGPLLAHDLVAHLLADGAHEVVVAAHTADDPREPRAEGRLRPRPGSTVVLAVERFALAWEARRPRARIEQWVLTDDGYLDLDCADPACCPLGGRPVQDVAGSELARRLDATGPVAPRRADLARIPPAPAGARRSADSARLRWADRLRRARRLRADDGAGGDAPVGGGGGGGLAGAGGRAGAGGGGADPRPRAGGEGADPRPRAGGEGAGARAGTGAGTGAAAGGAWQQAAVLRWRRDSLDLWTAAVAEARDPATGGAAVHGPATGGAEAACGSSAADVGSGGAAGGGVAGGGDGAAARKTAPEGGGARERSDGRATAPRVLGRIEAALTDRVLRDAVLLTILAPGSALPDRVLAGGDAGCGPDGVPVGPQIGAVLDSLLSAGGARRPDPVATATAVRVLERVVAHGRVRRQAPARTLLALVAWWTGDGPRASVLVERALRDDPTHGLAHRVRRLVDSGTPPAWVRAER